MGKFGRRGEGLGDGRGFSSSLSSFPQAWEGFAKVPAPKVWPDERLEAGSSHSCGQGQLQTPGSPSTHSGQEALSGAHGRPAGMSERGWWQCPSPPPQAPLLPNLPRQSLPPDYSVVTGGLGGGGMSLRSVCKVPRAPGSLGGRILP